MKTHDIFNWQSGFALFHSGIGVAFTANSAWLAHSMISLTEDPFEKLVFGGAAVLSSVGAIASFQLVSQESAALSQVGLLEDEFQSSDEDLERSIDTLEFEVYGFDDIARRREVLAWIDGLRSDYQEGAFSLNQFSEMITKAQALMGEGSVVTPEMLIESYNAVLGLDSERPDIGVYRPESEEGPLQP